MIEYRLYRFEGGHIKGVVHLEGVDDADVLAQCADTVDGGVYELWESTRLVRRFDEAAE